ncbi:MAG: hypothetical protein WC531_02840 [Candidatus Paceibacterota bacterium]|jgi:hypothetical protein
MTNQEAITPNAHFVKDQERSQQIADFLRRTEKGTENFLDLIKKSFHPEAILPNPDDTGAQTS